MSVVVETTAKFKAICPVCFGEIKKGEPIRLYREFKGGRKRWAHANCYHTMPVEGEAEQDSPAPAADLTDDAKERITDGNGRYSSQTVAATGTLAEARQRAWKDVKATVGGARQLVEVDVLP